MMVNLSQHQENRNLSFYDELWEDIDLIELNFGPAWETVCQFRGKKMLEIGPGNFPRIPIKRGYFVDISESALKQLRALGGKTLKGDASLVLGSLPNDFFDLILAWDILEHIEDDRRTIKEIQRILKKGSYLSVALPIRMAFFSPYDVRCGHQRRYESEELVKKFSNAGFKIVKWRRGGFCSYSQSFASARACLANFNPQSPTKILPRFIIRTILKFYYLFEQLTDGKWQTGPLKPGRRVTRLEILCKKI